MAQVAPISYNGWRDALRRRNETIEAVVVPYLLQRR